MRREDWGSCPAQPGTHHPAPKPDLPRCSNTRQSAEAFARKINIPHVYTDHRALLERKDIHLVSLPVVTSLHHTLAIDTANAGKHIVMEKPLSGLLLAHETVMVIYAGYVSAEEGRRVDLARQGPR